MHTNLTEISDLEKLRVVNSRRQQYLQSRKNDFVDLLVRLRTALRTVAQIRAGETKGILRWFPPAAKRAILHAAAKRIEERGGIRLIGGTSVA
jgi:hypothetical protein